MLTRGAGAKLFDRETKEMINYPLAFLPPPHLLLTSPFLEEFRLVSQEHFPEIVPVYAVSTHGRMWHTVVCDFMTQNFDSKGYLYKPLMLKSGTQRNYRVHRLEAETFMYEPGCEELVINHKDGNKANDLITNLEWTTYSENNYHAVRTGLTSPTHASKFGDPNLINAICADLQEDKLSRTEIAAKHNVPVDLVTSILQRRAHTYYSQNYHLPDIQKQRQKFDDDIVNKACQYFVDNPKPKVKETEWYFKDAAKHLGLDESDRFVIHGLRDIRNRRTFKKITDNYDF